MFQVGVLILLLFYQWAFAARDPEGFEDGNDLESFVTRPDLRAPRYIVTKNHIDAIAPGYWFVAHYPTLYDAPSTWRKEHVPYQTGIHIYDNNGDLVWSGAKNYRNTNSFAFRSFEQDGEYFLSYFVGAVKEDNVGDEKREQGGVTMNSRYEEVTRTKADASQGLRVLDVHEFTILPGGDTALLSVNYPDSADGADIGQGKRFLITYGFQEIEIGTGRLIFDWEPLSHGVSLSESMDTANMMDVESTGPWDWFHLNSVDKDIMGDYLISARHTSTIYKVSGRDGEIAWRLGGKKSDFQLEDGVHFEWQHHVRFISENETSTIISVFDNASEDQGRNPDIPQLTSVGKIIHLDRTTMTASLLRSFERPDGGSTPKLGSVQVIGDDVMTANVFIDWGQSAFVSEYDGQGRMVLEAKLPSDRMWTYRAYKLPWVGRPSEPIALKGLPTVYGEGKPAVTYYVSWNGATEVTSWSFYSGGTPDGPFEKLATVAKFGFETSWTTSTIQPYTYVEGIDKDGEVLGVSNVTALMVSKQWQFTAATESALEPIPSPKASESVPAKEIQLQETNESIEEEEADQTMEEEEAADQGVEDFDLIGTLPYLVVDSLALYALYVIFKALIPKLLKQRGGYSRVAAGLDEPILGSPRRSAS